MNEKIYVVRLKNGGTAWNIQVDALMIVLRHLEAAHFRLFQEVVNIAHDSHHNLLPQDIKALIELDILDAGGVMLHDDRDVVLSGTEGDPPRTIDPLA